MSWNSFARRGDCEIVILNSRFIASGAEVKTASEAEAFLKEIQGRYPDASHHCYAFKVLGPPMVDRFSDDGEPNGTAGRPILTVLEHHLNNAIIVVTRYFGGTKLGKGGLVKAYTEAAKNLIDSLGTTAREHEISVLCEYPYPLSATVEYYFKLQGLQFELDYGASVQADLQVAISQWPQIQTQFEHWQYEGFDWEVIED